MAAKTSSHAPARGRKKGERSGLTEARIEELADLMRSLKWERGKTVKDYALRWGVSLSTVEHLAADASRKVCAEFTDPDATHCTVAGSLDKVIQDGLAADDAFHRKNVIEAGRRWVDLVTLVEGREERELRREKLRAEVAIVQLNLRQAQRLAGESGTDPADGYEDPAVDPAPADPEAVGGGPGDP